jgi:hypothetical protein
MALSSVYSTSIACMEHLNTVFYRYNIIETGKTVADEEFIY